MKYFYRLFFAFFFWILNSIFCYSQIVINEYSCSNVSSYADNFGGFEDWIELYNTTASPVNLTGYYLSDRKTNPTKWQLGNVTIAANGFLRVWASNRRINSGANLHTSFKLTQCKPEAIVLSNASAVILDSLTLKRTQAGHSRGRTTNGAATWNVFLNPTSNASNNTATPYQNYATTPTMNVAAGFYTSAQSVSITSPDPGVTIRYTLNGTTPTAASTIYSSPLIISITTVLRAKAFSSTPTIPASFVESNTYFINSSHTTEVISVFGDQILTLLNGTQNTPQTGLEYFDNTGTFRTESYGISNKHGNDSWAYPQRGIDFISKDEYGYNYALLHPLFNVKARNEFQRIILKPGASDNYPFESGGAHIRDAYVQTVSQKAKLFMDERTWAPSILYVNGQYWGVYETREKVDDSDFTNYYYNTDSQYSTFPNQDSLQYLKTWGLTWADYGGDTAINNWNTLKNFITGNSMAVQANYNFADNLYNVKSLADYVILNSYTVNADWLNWNTSWWRGKNVNAAKKKWRYTLWDMDATFGHYINYTNIPNTGPNADPCDPTSPQFPQDPGGQGHIPILKALLKNPGFHQYYTMRYFDLLNTSLNCNRMITILDSMVLVITPEMPRHIIRWGGTMPQWQGNVQAIRNFILTRCTSVVNNFAPCNGTTGPYPIKLNVVPAGAGIVDVNSITVSTFVWSATYPGGVNMNLTAHANPTYCFSHWEFKNHTPLPSISDTAVYFNLTQSDSIIAHFALSGGVPTITATNTTICAGDATTLQASTGTSYLWSPSTGLSCTTCQNPVATPTVTTTYSVIVSGTCASGTATITINVDPPIPPTVTAANPAICVGSSTTLNVSGGGNPIWSPSPDLSCTNCSNPVATPSVTTTYSVTVSPANCVEGTNVVTVNVNQLPVPNVGSDPTICTTGSTELLVSGGTNYAWSPSIGLSCINCPNPTATPNATTTYYIVVSDAMNCKAIDSIIVFVSGECQDIYVPTGFSPNGDNNNDMFFVFGEMKEMHLVVYNRWGQIVFESWDKMTGWDGKHNGKPVQSGVYAYKFSATDSRNKPIFKSGNMTVIR